MGETPEHCVIRSNLVAVTLAVEKNLDVICTRLQELSFITDANARAIRGTSGKSPYQQATELLNAVQIKVTGIYSTREQSFENFMDILANDTTEQELVKKLTQELVENKPEYQGKLLKYIRQGSTKSAALSAPANRISRSSRPKLPVLLSFPRGNSTIDLTIEIGESYSKFAVFLLNDETGAIITALESQHHNDAAKINSVVFTKWLTGVNEVDVTWNWLVECLRKANLHALADSVDSELQD